MLPRRDFLVLPLISLVTILALWGGAEIAGRIFFAESGREVCLVKGSSPQRMTPNCVSHRKAAEGPEVEMAYNDCGYRTRETCHARPAEALRIALLGASTAQGFKVPYEQSFGARLGRALTRACGKPVEVQNLAVPGYELVDSYMRLDEALALKPDAVLFLFGPYDIEAVSSPQRLAARDHSIKVKKTKRLQTEARARPLFKRLIDMTAESQALVMVQHFLYSDRLTYVKLFLMYGDKADYVRPPFSNMWQKRLAILDMLLEGMAAKTRAAGVPLVDVIAPTELQVSLLNAADVKAEAGALDKKLIEIATSHGVGTADGLDAFRTVESPSDVFYPVDGHLNGNGHALLAESVLRRLTDGSVAPFAGCKTDRVARMAR